MKQLLSTMLAVLIAASLSWAKNWYVLKGASGANHGADWTNAWNEMDQINWASVSPGDTIWLAGGSYTHRLTIGASGSPQAPIHIKRVLSTDSVPVAAAGWNAAYDAQVVITYDANGIMWSSSAATGLGSYVTIDGRVDAGIQVVLPYNASEPDWSAGCIWIGTPSVTNITLQHIDLKGECGSTACTRGNDTKVLHIYNGSNPPAHLTVRHCRLHGSVDQIMMVGLNGGLFEYNKLYDNLTINSATYHPGTIACRICHDTIIYRYNEHYNLSAEGIMLGASSGDVGCTWKIYGNVDHHGSGSKRFVEVQYTSPTVYAYNNTIVDQAMGFRVPTGMGGSLGPGSSIQNNILYNVTAPFAEGTDGFHDYNAVSGANPETHGVANLPSDAFIDYPNGNYRIAATVGTGYPRNQGTALGAEYNSDMDGNLRGSDGAWDMGAYEYTATGIKNAKPEVYPNLLPAALVKWYFQFQPEVEIYDLAGKNVGITRLPKDGLYIIKYGPRNQLEKMVITN
jgi:hypothetical protein